MGGSKSKAKNELTAHDRAMLDLQNQRDQLKQYRDKLETVMTKEMEMARELVAAGKKKQALLCLKKKRFQETSLERAEGMLFNIEELINSVEFAQMQKETFDRLKEGRDALQEIQSEMDLNEIDQIMADTKEAMAYQDQISERLGTQLTEVDEEAIAAELAELMASDLEAISAPTDALPEKTPEPAATNVVAAAVASSSSSASSSSNGRVAVAAE
eukprot:CAMPEP_0177656616 /NCGR_PEP_ID=MMETSP0447-20121125/15678_1 /TAXON_ID=0 /ORGANISM="Stygamoeba regulata, Strain BSH-02190019" /LENGTH=214 /DNA_ID=CAMNT_0019160779 /DNA_START=52 /DNA_END=696 /DNA_ORIENTATION=+